MPKGMGYKKGMGRRIAKGIAKGARRMGKKQTKRVGSIFKKYMK